MGLLYRNLFTGDEHPCGVVRACTPQALLLEWILTEGKAMPCDLIRFESGTVLVLMPTGAKA